MRFWAWVIFVSSQRRHRSNGNQRQGSKEDANDKPDASESGLAIRNYPAKDRAPQPDDKENFHCTPDMLRRQSYISTKSHQVFSRGGCFLTAGPIPVVRSVAQFDLLATRAHDHQRCPLHHPDILEQLGPFRPGCALHSERYRDRGVVKARRTVHAHAPLRPQALEQVESLHVVGPQLDRRCHVLARQACCLQLGGSRLGRVDGRDNVGQFFARAPVSSST